MTNIIAFIALAALLLAGCKERPPNQVVLINIPVQQVGTNRFVFEMMEMPNGQWIGYINGIAISTNDPLPLKPMRYDIETVKKAAERIRKEPPITNSFRYTTNAQYWNHQGNQITEEEWQRIADYYGVTKP